MKKFIIAILFLCPLVSSQTLLTYPWLSMEAGMSGGFGSGAGTSLTGSEDKQVGMFSAYAGFGLCRIRNFDTFVLFGWDYIMHSTGDVYAEAGSVMVGLQVDLWDADMATHRDAPYHLAISFTGARDWIVSSEYNYGGSRYDFNDDHVCFISIGLRADLMGVYVYPNIRRYTDLDGDRFKFSSPVLLAVEFGFLYL